MRKHFGGMSRSTSNWLQQKLGMDRNGIMRSCAVVLLLVASGVLRWVMYDNADERFGQLKL